MKKISLIGYSCDSGGTVKGSKKGPAQLRKIGLAKALSALGLTVKDLGDATSKASGSKLKKPNSTLSADERLIRDLTPVHTACASLYEKVTTALNAKSMPVVLGGDHSLSVGSVAAVADFYRAQKKEIGLVWVDAHPDFNTPKTSPSKKVYGMSVAILSGHVKGSLANLQKFQPAVREENIAFIAQRDIDPEERELLRRSKINVFTMREVDLYGMAEVARRAIAAVTKKTAGVVVSFDLDALDPSLVPGTGTPIRGGLTVREAHLLLELIHESGKLLSFELVELNPHLDQLKVTAELALWLTESAMGKKIF